VPALIRGKPLLFAVVVVLVLVSLFWATGNPLLFYALYPGNIVSLLIAGGHGGTRAEEAIATIIGILVNVAAYVVVIIARNKIMDFLGWSGGLPKGFGQPDTKR
jgi:hypothetical protein